MNIAILEVASRVRLTVLADNNILLSRNLNKDNFLNEAYITLVPLSINELRVVLLPTLLGEKPEGDILVNVLKLGSSTRYLCVSQSDVDKLESLGRQIGAENLRVITMTDVARMYSKYKPYIVCYEGLNQGYYFLVAKDCQVTQHIFNLVLNEKIINSLKEVDSVEDVISYYNDLFVSELELEFPNLEDMTKEEQRLITPALTAGINNLGFVINLRDNDNFIAEQTPQDFSDTPDLSELEEFKNLNLKPDGSEEPMSDKDLDSALDDMLNEQLGEEQPNDYDDNVNLFEDSDEPKTSDNSEDSEQVEVMDDKPEKPHKKKDKFGAFLTAIGCVVVIAASASLTINKFIPQERVYLQQKEQQLTQLVKPLQNEGNYYENYSKALAKGQNYDTPIFKEISAVKVNGVVLEAKTENNNVAVKVFLVNPKDIGNVQKEFSKLFNVTNVTAGATQTMDGHTLTPFDISGTLRE